MRAHPCFADFASGMLWQHDHDIKGCSLSYFPSEQLAELKRRFPPRKLEGLIGFDWCPHGGKNNQRKPGELPKQTRRDSERGGEYAGVDV